jgi:hypothetical protein
LVAAQRDGLLSLFGLEHPLELSGSVLGPGDRPNRPGQGLIESFERARQHTGGFVAIDAPEYALAALPGDPAELAAEYVRELSAGASSSGLAVVVNLNLASPPTWERDLGGGPLFAEMRQQSSLARVTQLADALREAVMRLANPTDSEPPIELAWHLTATDFTKEKKDQLLSVCGLVAHGKPLTFHFDRPRRPISLAAGLTREHPACLMAVGVHLPRLAEQTPALQPEAFLRKIGTLARLARSAGHSKQDFLRHRSRPAVTGGFLLDRARLIVVPVGLETVVHRFTGQTVAADGSGPDFARQVLAHLREALAHDKPRTMDAGLDSAPPLLPANLQSNNGHGVSGLTRWDRNLSGHAQLRANGVCHAVAEGGTAIVLTATGDCEALAALLKYAWTQTDVWRVRFASPS